MSASVAAAIEDHYRPQGPNDRVPADPVAMAVALADKLDILTGFWAIDEKPTGSKDPYALRRAALGVIRILVEGGVRLALPEGHRIRLVSELAPEVVAQTFATFAPSIDAALAETGRSPRDRLDDVVVLWRAGEAIVDRVP